MRCASSMSEGRGRRTPSGAKGWQPSSLGLGEFVSEIVIMAFYYNAIDKVGFHQCWIERG